MQLGYVCFRAIQREIPDGRTPNRAVICSRRWNPQVAAHRCSDAWDGDWRAKDMIGGDHPCDRSDHWPITQESLKG